MLRPGAVLPKFAVDEFASAFLRARNNPSTIRDEDLADTFRSHFGLSPYPPWSQLTSVCKQLGIEVRRLPRGVDPDGLNSWDEIYGHKIHLNDSIEQCRMETTLGHELREVLEQAFGRVPGRYVALDTSNNRIMNPHSDRFAGALLLHGATTRLRLEELGFDLVALARQTGRSLSSVILRVQELYPADEPPGVVGGMWLFEASRGAYRVRIEDFRVKYKAHVCGFSVAKASARPADQIARQIFPRTDSALVNFSAAVEAYGTRLPKIEQVEGLDLFGQHNYIVVAEPIVVGRVLRGVLMTAVLREYEPKLAPWLARLAMSGAANLFQRA